MNVGDSTLDFGALPVSFVRQVDRTCDEFETAWRAGQRPRIEDYLREAPEPGRSALLRALLALELESRRRAGERPDREDYLDRFPTDVALIDSAFDEPASSAEIDASPARVTPPKGDSIAQAISRSFATAGSSPARTIWVWPIIAAAVLAIAGFWAHTTIERVMRVQLATGLLALRDADLEAMRLLFGTHQAVVSIAAADPRIQGPINALCAGGDRQTTDLLRSPELAKLRTALGSWLGRYEYHGFQVLDRRGRIIGAWGVLTVGSQAEQEETECLATVFAGRATVSRPHPSEAMLTDVDGIERLGLPAMFVLAPVRNDDGQVIAALGFRMRPERTFARVLAGRRLGRTGETYAFDRAGRLLSGSRFDDDLKRIGLVSDESQVRSTLGLELRDPGVDLTTGAKPERRRESPLTRSVAEAVRGRSGVDVEGYRDYRGVPVIGAWSWLPEFGFGLAVEVDREEAYRPLVTLHNVFRGLFALTAAAAIALFASTVLVARLRRRMQAAALVAKQLGRYTLDGKIGEGGMGVVYRAHHAMLRRPTAVKLLNPDKANEKAMARFEREVQSTGRLTHPNTVTIYDYGRTSEGIFYYAMEYLDGIDLQRLVTRYGPQPEGRVIQILTQVCGSLEEAHGIGLIHRDIKPSNIILTRRGGLCDFVKLVDFGLAKAVDAGRAALTSTDAIVGTPLYMAPEAIRPPGRTDARSDLYSVGAVGYFLLTGQPLFHSRSLPEILFQQVSTTPIPPSDRLGHAVAPELEALLLRCLAKDPADRPTSAGALADALGSIAASAWSKSDAESWWRAHNPGGPAPPPSPSPLPTSPRPVVLVDHRDDL